MHFGHCEDFAIIDAEDGKILSETRADPPVHSPGAYPQFLSKLGVDAVIAGGMGSKAKEIFERNKIDVCSGVASGDPKSLVQKYMEGALIAGGNLCDK